MTTPWGQLRVDQFPICRNWAYFNHAATGPIPKRASNRIREWTDRRECEACLGWSDWLNELAEVRRNAAKLLGSSEQEIAFINSTTQGIGLIAEGFPWKNGDNLVASSEEYPSNLYPWMNLKRRGVELRLVPKRRDGRILVEDFLDACDRKTRMITVSFVGFASGFRVDLAGLAEACRKRDIALMVDGIQGLGVLPLNVREIPIDFVAADGHKWLLGPEGAGILYIRSDWIDRLDCLGVGAHSVKASFDYSRIDYDLKADASRWEGGTYNLPGLLGFGQCLRLFAELGYDQISYRVLEQADRVREICQHLGWKVFSSSKPGETSGIVSAYREGVDPDQATRVLLEHKVVVSGRGGRLRISPHIYTNQDDLDRLQAGLVKLSETA